MALSLLPGLVTADLASADHAEKVQELCTAIRREQLAVLPLVTALGPYLTSTTDPVRTRAITVLAEVGLACGENALAQGAELSTHP